MCKTRSLLAYGKAAQISDLYRAEPQLKLDMKKQPSKISGK
jgi:hypothetical protein